MNIKVIVVVLVAVAIGAFVLMDGSEKAPIQTAKQLPKNPVATKEASPAEKAVGDPFPARDEDGFVELDDVPADQKYKSHKEALDAVKKGAVDYDDFLIEEFVELKECPWCDQLYSDVRGMLNDPNVDIDQRGFYGELLAVTGRIDNIEPLVKGIESAKDEDSKDMYSESLEMAIGGDDMLEYLKPFMESSDELLRESTVAAISNQGSRFAVELLHQDLVRRNDKEREYYSYGTGLGEVVPDEEALPYLQDLIVQKDEYSDLAIKSLINAGYQGVVLVFDSLAAETDQEKGKKLLDEAVDHVIYEEELETFLKKAVENPNYPQFLKDFAKESLEEIEDEEDYY